MDKPTINTSEAARRAGVSGDTIRRWARLGYLHPIRVGPGRRYRIDPVELLKVVDGTETDSAHAEDQPESADAVTSQGGLAVHS